MTEKSKNTVISVQDIGLQQFHLNEDGADVSTADNNILYFINFSVGLT
jgi:hypothetical protein